MHRCVNRRFPLASRPLDRPGFFEHTLQIGLVSKRGPTSRFLKPLACPRSQVQLPHRGCATCPWVCDICNTISSVWHISYTTWHGSCTSKDHARQASLLAMPTLRRRVLPWLPNSTTLPPRGTRGLRASPAPGRVPLLMVNRMRYVLAIAFRIVAWGLHAYLLPSSNVLSLVYRMSVRSMQQGD